MPSFDDPAATWDDPAPSGWSSTQNAQINAALTAAYPSVRAELIWKGHVIPATPQPLVGLAAGTTTKEHQHAEDAARG